MHITYSHTQPNSIYSCIYFALYFWNTRCDTFHYAQMKTKTRDVGKLHVSKHPSMPCLPLPLPLYARAPFFLFSVLDKAVGSPFNVHKTIRYTSSTWSVWFGGVVTQKCDTSRSVVMNAHVVACTFLPPVLGHGWHISRDSKSKQSSRATDLRLARPRWCFAIQTFRTNDSTHGPRRCVCVCVCVRQGWATQLTFTLATAMPSRINRA